jgi:DNA-binding transcriptional LysR family regulator
MNLDLNSLSVFIALAEAKSFRAAAERLGVSRPAVSQAIQRLEDRLGAALVQRTTRSVSLTEMGMQLYQRVAPAVSEVALALEATRDREAKPTGLLRLAVSSIAERFISGPLVAGFTEAYPGISLDITVTDEEFDIVAEGYDAGVRLGEVIEQDMIAVAVSDEQRQLVVGSPAYFKKHGRPKHPTELSRHRCIGWRPSPRVEPYRWEFGRNGREFDVAVNPEVTTNDMWVMVRTACAGGGLTFGMEETFLPYIRRGELEAVLEDYCPRFAGFFLYFAARRNAPPKLRALIDHFRFRPATGS